MKARPCIKLISTGDGFLKCPYPAMQRKQSCRWHWLQNQATEIQQEARADRLTGWGTTEPIARVPAEEWPPGERWCAGCQSMVPLFYCTGSRCKACSSAASHEAMVQKTYDLEPGEYDALFRLQGGRCYVCQRRTARRLAVDHDHVSGAVRGLLCADPARGCNHAVLGSLEGPGRDPLAQARRLVEYLEHTPYDRLKGRPARPVEIPREVRPVRHLTPPF